MESNFENILKSEDIAGAVTALIEEVKKDREKKIQELILQIDRLNREVEQEKEELRKRLNETFLLLEELSKELEGRKKEIFIKTLEEHKLRSLEFLGILKETAEAAIIAALEKNEDIEETIEEITKHLTFENLGTRVDSEHIKDISEAILEVAAEIASASVNYSDEIIKGSVKGVKEGIEKSIEKFKESLEFTPKEARELLVENYTKIVKDLENTESIYIESIENVAARSDAGIKEKLLTASEEMKGAVYRLTHVSQEAIEAIKNRFSELAKEASATTSIFKAKAEEAKKLGVRVLSIAKSAIDGAIKGAKEAMEKIEEDKKE